MSNQSFTQGSLGARCRPVSASLVALLLSACAAAPQPAIQAAPAAPAAPADPVLQAVAAGALNTPVTVTGPQGDETVTVLSDYISGEGDECRTYNFGAPGAAPAEKLACHDGGAWREIPPLAPAANPETLP